MDELAHKIDHTLLRADTSRSDIQKLCEEAMEYGFYSVCVNPSWVPQVRRLLSNSSVKICSVVGFPLGASSTKTKAYETADLLEMGAHEVDMVINIGELKDQRDSEVVFDIEAVVRAAKSCPVKVIIETALLTESEKVRAVEAIVKAGARFVKTCTGFNGGAASVSDIQLIRQKAGQYMGIKASGGIRTRQQAEELLKAGATRLGCSQSVQIIKEGTPSK